MAILYINGEHCTTLSQLREYFSYDFDEYPTIYSELLDVSRHGELEEWLRDNNEEKLSEQVASLDTKLSDSDRLNLLRKIFVVENMPPIPRPTFEDCFEMKEFVKKGDSERTTVNITLQCKVENVNENYTVQIVSQCGTRGYKVNPADLTIGDEISLNFDLRRFPEKEIGEIYLKIDNKTIRTKNK